MVNKSGEIKQELTLKVNGESYALITDPDTPLLYVLRNHLELNGPKYGCGLGQCGSCMVLIDGIATPSCSIPVSGINNRNIVTLEGLVKNNSKLHPVQKAIVSKQAAQCGYCTNGIIICAVSLLANNPSPSNQEIKNGMERVLCRCGTHSRFVKAIHSVTAKSK